MAKKESTIIYDKHVEIFSKYLTDEQFGKLMFALIKDEEPDFGDDQMLAMAFAFIALQKDMDDKKYEERCEKNRKNGRLGGRPKKGEEKPKKANGFFENPNDNDNEKDKDKDNDNDAGFSGQNPVSSADSISSFFGEYDNVELTNDQRQELADRFERSGALIDEVSDWIRNAKNHVPDHYGLCIRWAKKAGWPKRRQIEPPESIVIADPLDPDEQERMVAQMRKTVGGMFTGS